MSPRQAGLRCPRQYVQRGEWPHAELAGPRLVEYAQAFARRLHTAAGSRSLRDLARSAGLSHSTLLAVLRGDRWPDMVTIAKLEEALQADLWPGPEVRGAVRLLEGEPP